MLTESDDSGEGEIRAYQPDERRIGLYRFLQNCRTPADRNVSKLAEYFADRRYRYFAHLDPYCFDESGKYFEAVPADRLTSALIFLDPDIGLQVGKPSYMRKSGIDKYLSDESIFALGKRSSADSVFLLYQHLQKDSTKRHRDLEERANRFRDLLSADHAVCLSHGDLAFIAAARTDEIERRVKEAFVQHAEKHRMKVSLFGFRSAEPATVLFPKSA